MLHTVLLMMLTHDGSNFLHGIIFFFFCFLLVMLRKHIYGIAADVMRELKRQRDETKARNIKLAVQDAGNQILPFIGTDEYTIGNVLGRLEERPQTLEEYTGFSIEEIEARWPGKNVCEIYNKAIAYINDGVYDGEASAEIIEPAFVVTTFQ